MIIVKKAALLAYLCAMPLVADAKMVLSWIIKDSKNFVFHYTDVKPMTKENFDFHENNLAREMEFLKIGPPKGKIHYFFYPDKEVMKKKINFDGNAIASLSGPPNDLNTHFEIHSIYPKDNHEIIHVLLFQKGMPLAMWSEGIAVYRSGLWYGKKIKFAANEVIEKQPSLTSLLNDKRFRSDDMISYPLAGALTEFLIEKYGINIFLDSYAELAKFGSDISKSQIDSVTTSLYQKSFAQLESEFRVWLKIKP